MSMPEKRFLEPGGQAGQSGEAISGVRLCSPEHGVFCDEAWAAIAKAIGLLPCESEVARRAVAGHGERQIARALGLSEKTVMNRVYARLGIHSRVELGTLACAAYRAWRDKSSPPNGCP